MAVSETNLKQFYRPRGPNNDADDRKKRFDALNRAATAAHAWLTSVPGAPEVTMECFESSSFPDQLREAGYQLEPLPPGERILHSEITEKVLTRASSVPITFTYAGIVPVKRYSFTV